MNGVVAEKILNKIFDVLCRIEKQLKKNETRWGHELKEETEKETPIGRIKWWKDESTKLDDF